MRNIFIIWNPAAGGRGARVVQQLKGYLDNHEISYTIEDTHLTKNATNSVKEKLNDSFTDLIIVGGDGTINEAINGLDYDIPVGIIPAGTGDDFIKMVEIGKSISQQIETAVHGSIRSIDLGECNGRKFINGVGIGFDGQIVEDMVAKRVPLLKGHAAYYYHVLRILGWYKEKTFKYQLDEQKQEKDLILLTIGNGSTFGGGFKLMPEAKIDDGVFEVCSVGKLSGLKRFLNIHRLSNGTHGILKAVDSYQAKEVYVEENPQLFAHIDGERMGQPPYKINVIPNALRVRVTS